MFFDDECVIDDAKTIAALFGFDVSNIAWSGFDHQGSGCAVEGRYRYKKGALKAVRKYAPSDTALHAAVKQLQEAQRKAFYKVRAKVYARQLLTKAECKVYTDTYNYPIDADKAVQDDIEEALQWFADWVYDNLRRDYEHQQQEEQPQDE